MAIFTPGRQTDEEVKASFIARQAVLDLILDDVRATRAKSIPQHHIIIGQRGMGKTTLLRRLHVALREEPLSQSFIPLGFPEEQYSVDRLSTVFLNCLDALADTLEQENSSEQFINKIDEAVERLRKDRASEELVAQDAEQTLLALSAETGRRPVLLVDNLGLIFQRLKKPELHALRAFLMKAGAPIVIGASAQMLDQDYAAPFYDHFKPHHLARLSYDEMREVLLKLAGHAGNTDIPARLDQERGRLHALHALTGGNPRTTRILFDVFSHGFSQEAYQDLEMLLDWMTPLYKARFEELSPQAQIVVSAIATMWEPVVISRICEATRLQPNQISPQLDRLKKADVIEEVTVDPPDRTGPIPDQRTPRDRTGYQIAERFFNIWFLMRQATRRDKRNLIYLTRFIECLHSTDERDQFAKDLLDQPALSKSQKIYALALEQSLKDRHLKLRLHDHVESEFIKAHRQKIEELEDILDLAEIPPHRWEFAELRERLIKAVPKDSPVAPEEFADVILSAPLFVGRREEIAEKTLNESEVAQLVEEAKASVHSLKELVASDAVEWFTALLRTGVVIDTRDPAHLSTAMLRADTPEKMEMCVLIGEAAKNLNEITDGAFEAVAEKQRPHVNSDHVNDWLTWARKCHFTFERPLEALSAYKICLKYLPEQTQMWGICAHLLETTGADVGQVAEAYRKAIATGSEDAHIWMFWGVFLEERLDNSSAAESAYTRATVLDSKLSWAWFRLGLLQYLKLGYYQRAEESLRAAIQIEPEKGIYRRYLADLLMDKPRRQLTEAISEYQKAASFEPNEITYLIPLAEALAEKASGRSEAEVLLRKAASVDPSSAYAKAKLAAFIEKYSRKKMEAVDLWFDVIELDPTNSGAWASIGAWLAQNGASEEARRYLNRAISLSSVAVLGRFVSQVLENGSAPLKAKKLLDFLMENLPTNRRSELDFVHVMVAAAEENWGQASSLIRGLIERLGDRAMFPKEQQDDWLTLSAALLHYGYGEKLLELLAETGADQKLRPWAEATRALLRGDRKYLRNAPVEVRDSASVLFAQIEAQLAELPQETRRWHPASKPIPVRRSKR